MTINEKLRNAGVQVGCRSGMKLGVEDGSLLISRLEPIRKISWIL
jgi:hypothetical protein